MKKFKTGHVHVRGRKRRERTEGSKNVQTTPTRTYCKRNRPLPYYHPNCRTPQHWTFTKDHRGGGRVVRRYWVNFQCWGVLLIWIIVGQGPFVLALGAGGGCLDIFSLICHFSALSPSLWETARYRLKYCLKGPLSPKQPTNQPRTIATPDHPRSCDRSLPPRSSNIAPANHPP